MSTRVLFTQYTFFLSRFNDVMCNVKTCNYWYLVSLLIVNCVLGLYELCKCAPLFFCNKL